MDLLDELSRGESGQRGRLRKEPTASLDAKNREVVIGLIRQKKAEGVAMLGIFHDEDVRDAVADRIIDVTGFSARNAAA